VTIVTKSAAILRDVDLLAPMAADRLAMVFVSVTSLDPDLARKLEPRAAAPHRRLQVIRELRAAGIPVGAMVAPVIPGLNDHQLEAIVAAVAAVGAQGASYVLLRLPHEIKDLFERWLEAHAPLRKDHVLSLVRACRDGRLNDSTFGRRMRGEGVYAQLIARRFAVARRKHGLDRIDRTLRSDLFEPPAGDRRQLRLI
jgi:DNA repair photolyase